MFFVHSVQLLIQFLSNPLVNPPECLHLLLCPYLALNHTWTICSINTDDWAIGVNFTSALYESNDVALFQYDVSFPHNKEIKISVKAYVNTTGLANIRRTHCKTQIRLD